MAKSFTKVVPDFKGVVNNLEVLADRLRNNVAVMALKSGVVAVEAAAVRTPVDEGDARSNWTLGPSKVTTVRPSYITGKRHMGIGERTIYQAVVAEAERSARSISRDHVVAGRSVWVCNPVHYIGDLNSGSSPQNREGNFDVIAAQLAEAYIGSFIRSGKLLTSVESI